MDDNIDTVKERLKNFAELNLPVIKHYSKKGKLYKVSASYISDNYITLNSLSSSAMGERSFKIAHIIKNQLALLPFPVSVLCYFFTMVGVFGSILFF